MSVNVKKSYEGTSKKSIVKHSYFIMYKNIVENLGHEFAFCLWTFLLGLPDGWKINEQHLMKTFKCGSKKIQSAMSHLNKFNLISYERVRGDNGMYTRNETYVHDGQEYINNHVLNKNTIHTVKNDGVVNDGVVKGGTYNKLININKYKQEEDQKLLDNKDIKNISLLSCANSEKTELTHDTELQTFDHVHEVQEQQSTEIDLVDNTPDKVSKEISEVDKSFERFWESYPVKKGKHRAQSLWKSKKLSKHVDAIIEDVGLKLRSDSQWQDKQYIPHPSTYINQKRWEDEITSSTKCRGFLSPDHPMFAKEREEARKEDMKESSIHGEYSVVDDDVSSSSQQLDPEFEEMFSECLAKKNQARRSVG